MKSLLFGFSVALFAAGLAAADGSSDHHNNAVSSHKESGHSQDESSWDLGPSPATPAPPTKPNMKGQPRRPPPEKFVHYAFTDATRSTIKKYNLTANNVTDTVYNPTLPHGGASIYANQKGMSQAGWDIVYIQTEGDFTNKYTDEAFYAAGFAEGAETQERIYQNFVNIYPPTDKTNWTSVKNGCPKLCQDYIWAQWNWLKNTATKMIDHDYNANYWRSVRNSLSQVQGMMDGYNSTAPANQSLTWMQVYLVGFNFELSDVMHYVKWETNHSAFETPAPAGAKGRAQATQSGIEEDVSEVTGNDARPIRGSHCSALVKLTDDDLFMAHDTWSGYNTMLRQYKTYEFGNGTAGIPTISMSSYPGTLHSGDDWYMMSNGITSQETTNGNFNVSSQPLISNASVPEFIRVMVANRIAQDGKSWTETFSMHNSGTYNNQYMVVNHNLFNPKGKTAEEKAPDGTLWIVEQMPQMMKSKDVTPILRNQSYWASFNIPYLLNKEMNYPYMVKTTGAYNSYTGYARPRIFKKMAPGITDLEGMKKMMRYNDFMHDPDSLITNCNGTTTGKCVPAYSPSLTIAARCDLAAKDISAANAGPNWEGLQRFAFGAIDSKIVASSEVMMMQGHLVSGPTEGSLSTGDLPPFVWSTSGYTGVGNGTRMGQPDSWSFPYRTSTDLVMNDLIVPKKAKKMPPPNRLWILAVVFGLVALCTIVSYLLKAARDKKKEGNYNRLQEEGEGKV